jgi:cytochrome c1
MIPERPAPTFRVVCFNHPIGITTGAAGTFCESHSWLRGAFQAAGPKAPLAAEESVAFANQAADSPEFFP